MQRREFIVGLGAAITAPIQTDAQELPSVPLVGYLDDSPAEGYVSRQVLFREGLSVVDYYEGCNVAIESHWARLPDWASDLVSRGVAVLVASGSVSAIIAAKAATTTIPIVFAFGADPVQFGLVDSLNRPGGNVTGMSSMQQELVAKRLGLLHELLPGATRFGVLVNPSNFFSSQRMQIVALAAQHRVPALYFERDFAEAGGLMSYGPTSQSSIGN